MYYRELTAPPESIVKNGKPQFGAYSRPVKRLDLSDVKNPFSLMPMPRFISKLRIRADVSFIFNSDEYMGIISLLDVKYFCFAETVIWEKSTGKKYSYRFVFGFRRLVPRSLEDGRCFTISRRRYVRISWNRKTDSVSVVFTMKGDRSRPSFSGTFRMSTQGPASAEWFAVTPATLKRRCSATWYCTAPFIGSVTNHNTGVTSSRNENNVAYLDVRRIFCKLKTKETLVTGIGFHEGKKLVFRISSTSHDATENSRYNDNALFLDDEITLLPPVTVTCPFGTDGKWVIQDTENMVDLYFKPMSDHRRVSSIFILTADYHTVYGTFEGDLKLKDGSVIHLKDFQGIAQKQYLRM